MKTSHTPGPCETLARLTLQTNEYHNSSELKEAVDNVFGNPLFDSAPNLLTTCKATLLCLHNLRTDQLTREDGFLLLTAREILATAIRNAERGADKGGI